MFKHFRRHAAVYARGGIIVLLVFFVLAIPAFFMLPDEAPANGSAIPFPFYLWNRVSQTALIGAAAFVAGAFLAPTIRYFLAGKHPGLLLPLKVAFLSRTHRAAVAIAVIASLALIPLSYLIQERRFAEFFAESPGGLFALITGILSVVGVYLTLHVVLEVQNSILSFEDFVRRVEALIEDTSHNDYILMLLHTPATGCLVLKHSKWTRLASCILKSQKKFALTCLADDEMHNWFRSYLAGRQGDDLADMEKRIGIGFDASRNIKSSIARPIVEIREEEKEELGLVEGKWEDFPQFYLVSNSEKAIVVLPFFLPRPGVDIFSDTSKEVQMIGFETSNPGVVAAVHREIGLTRSYIEKERGPSQYGASPISPAAAQ